VRRCRSVAAHAQRGTAPSSPAGGVARRSDSAVRAFAAGDANQGRARGQRRCGRSLLLRRRRGRTGRVAVLKARGRALLFREAQGPLRRCGSVRKRQRQASRQRQRGAAVRRARRSSLTAPSASQRQHERAVRAAVAKQRRLAVVSASRRAARRGAEAAAAPMQARGSRTVLRACSTVLVRGRRRAARQTRAWTRRGQGFAGAASAAPAARITHRIGARQAP
jgi:hypothetical protein